MLHERHTALGLLVIVLVVSACEGSQPRKISSVVGEWTGDDEGWVAGFADRPTGVETSWHFEADRRLPPAPLSRTHKALFIGGDNHSDDLFMFWKRRVNGLVPGENYVASIEVVFGSEAPKSCAGTGGLPGDSVFLKAGMSTAEPLTRIADNGDVRITIDKGNQQDGGRDAVVMGNISNASRDCIRRRWEEKTLTTPTSVAVAADSTGSVWLVIGTDSGYESRTEIYYEKVRLRLDAP